MSTEFKPYDAMTPDDYAAIGLRCGLEVHQQKQSCSVVVRPVDTAMRSTLRSSGTCVPRCPSWESTTARL